MKYETAELEGVALDEACAIAEQRAYRRRKDGRLTVSDPGTAGQMADICIEGYQPSADWSWGGPIIERERMRSSHHDSEMYPGEPWHYWTPGNCTGHGPTALIAAMRAFVASKLGPWVELPD